MRLITTFSGVAGSSLGGFLCGHETVATVEIDKKCNKILDIRQPAAKKYLSIQDFNKAEDIPACDIIQSSWPCQAVSVIGKKGGMKKGSGTTSSLAFELIETLRRNRPKYFFGENVAAILNKKYKADFDSFLNELSQLGYGGVYYILSAADAGAVHRRDRFWLLAEQGLSGFKQVKPNRRGAKKGLWPTPRCGGRGSYEFIRKDGKRRDDLETTLFFLEVGLEKSGEEAKNLLGDMKMNADWVELMFGIPVGHTNPSCVKPKIHFDKDGNWMYPSLPGRPPLPHEPPRLIKIKKRSKAATLNNARLKQIGNMVHPICAKMAWEFLKNEVDKTKDARKVAGN